MSLDSSSVCPSSTYRVQLRSGTDFRRLAELVDYFADLGIGALYLSPFLRARSGSSHGYDVVDYGALEPALGSRDDLAELAARLRERGMTILADFVPNHMSASAEENPWWRDVLEAGRRSPFARFFDIDWSSVERAGGGRLQLPVLGASMDEETEKGLLALTLDELGVGLRYHEHRLPLAVATWFGVVDASADERLVELEQSLRGLARAGPDAVDAADAADDRGETEPAWENWEEKQRWKRRFVQTVTGSERLRGLVEEALTGVSQKPPRLRGIVDRQHYRLVPWREARRRMDFRRFFDIDDLVGVRVEDPEVFDRVHELLFELLESDVIQGIRIDHVDGLLDPEGYLEKLPANRYRIVEKILEPGETLRAEWPVAGTTGYEAMDLLHRVFVDPSSEETFRELYRDVSGVEGTMEDAVYEAKKHVLETSFRGETSGLAERLGSLLGEPDPCSLERALVELVACLPVYRTYVRPGAEALDGRDREVIDEALRGAKRRRAGNGTELDRIASVLRLELPADPDFEAKKLREETVLRFQQLTGPAMAKGVEDTALYRFYPLASLNDVGSSARFGVSVVDFHEQNAARARAWPQGLTATSTHDTKRGEDVRARLAVLSERPEAWHEAVMRWKELNHRHKRELPGGVAPDENEEYLLYQTLLGTWPVSALDEESRRRYRTRIQDYLRKALREAKRHTSWLEPDKSYEKACLDFVARVLDPSLGREFLDDFGRFEAGLRRAGLLNALSQLVLKATLPGIPDFYQGTESWDLSLVDPDNRGPVDFETRRALLRTVVAERASRGASQWLAAAMGELEDGRVKGYLTRELCRLRRSRHELFIEGGYAPVPAEGRQAECAVAFTRALGNEAIFVAVGRFFTRLGGEQTGPDAWGDTSLRVGEGSASLFHEVLSDRTVSAEHSLREGLLPLAEVFRYAPFAVLVPSS